MSRSRSRSPRVDEEFLRVREDLKRHVTAFNEGDNVVFDRLVAQYRKHTERWSSSGETAQILKHVVNVSAWIVFGTRTFGRERESVLQDLVVLLSDMLRARGRALPTPRLVHCLRYVEELLLDFDDLFERGLTEVQRAIMQHDLASVQSHEHGSQTGTQTVVRARPGTHGRTDQALVRRVLGERLNILPPSTFIRWDGRRRNWFGKNPTGTMRGTCANRSRFASDEDAIRHVADVLGI